MFMTDQDIQALTGYTMPAAQRRWLDKNGWEYATSAFGRPRVLQAYAEQRMGLAKAKPAAQTEPDFSRWKAA